MRLFLQLVILTILSTPLLTNSQTFDGTWSCSYATVDDPSYGNATGYNTISVAALEENAFVAIVRRSSNGTNFIVGYRDADSTNGRLGIYDYGSALAGKQTIWLNIFDQVVMNEALDLAPFYDGSSPVNKVVVANNDPDHNLLVFELKTDSVYTAPLRLKTGTDPIWAVDMSQNGYVFVTVDGDSTTPGKVLVFGGPDIEAGWTSFSHEGTALHTIDLPDAGSCRGVTVNSDATLMYVSNFTNNKVYCYIGNPTDGYTLFNDFDFAVEEEFLASSGSTLYPGPWGLNFMDDKNLLFVAADVNFRTGDGYEYGRIYILNPNNGSILDTIDVAEWNLLVNGVYNNRNDQNGISSGYTSTYNVSFDDNYNVYSQSYFGWTVEKWAYSGTLPTVPIIILSVEKEGETIPTIFDLEQNYPNPFNPETTIRFAIPKSGNVSLTIYDINGKLVEELIRSRYFDNGVYTVRFDASNLASGTYFYTLSNGKAQITKKMLLIK